MSRMNRRRFLGIGRFGFGLFVFCREGEGIRQVACSQ